MKRILFLVSAVLLLFSLWIVPASALIRPVDPPIASTPPGELDGPPVALPPSGEGNDHPIASTPPGELDGPPVALPPSEAGNDHPIASTPPGDSDGPPVALPPSETPGTPPIETLPPKRPDLLFVSTSLDDTTINFRLTNFDGTTPLKLQFSLDGETNWTDWPVVLTIDPPYLRSDNIFEEEITLYLRLLYDDGAVSDHIKAPMRPLPPPDPAPVPSPSEDPSGGDFDGGDREPQRKPSAPIDTEEDTLPLVPLLDPVPINEPQGSVDEGAQTPPSPPPDSTPVNEPDGGVDAGAQAPPSLPPDPTPVNEPDGGVGVGTQTLKDPTEIHSQGSSFDSSAADPLPSNLNPTPSDSVEEGISEYGTISTGSAIPAADASPADADTEKNDSVLVPVLILAGIFICVLFLNRCFWRQDK